MRKNKREESMDGGQKTGSVTMLTIDLIAAMPSLIRTVLISPSMTSLLKMRAIPAAG